jgi:hypothetical protein
VRRISKITKNSYQATNDSAHVEDSPEPGEVSSLGLFMRVGDHNGTLGGPQQTSTDTQKSAGEDVEATNISMLRGKQADGIDAIANTTQGESKSNTQPVDDGATEETEYSECAVQGSVLFHPSSACNFERPCELEALTMLSASVASLLPPPPMPPSALNIPGQRKQTNATMTN